MANKFTYKSFVDGITKDLYKDQKRQLNKGANLLKKVVKNTITSKGIIDEGNLLKGVASTTYTGTALVGMAPPAFHALIVEKGTVARFGKDGHGSGKMPATPYFLPAFKTAQADLIKILSEEW